MGMPPPFGGHRARRSIKVVCTSIKRVAKRNILEEAMGTSAGASRFRSREGCYLYGRIRRTDFLPVGEPQEEEVDERGIQSESSDEEDGPQSCWSNPLAGRMRGFDDEEESVSSASADEAAACKSDGKDVPDDIDFF